MQYTLSIIAFLLLGFSVHAAETKRRNILFCFADDWGRYANIYSKVETRPTINQVLKTPTIDRIAQEGVLFKNAFVNAPSCTPSRSAVLSGQYFFRTGRGAILHGAEWEPSIPSYPLLLRDAGYHIGKSYKVWGPGTPVDAPYGGKQYAYEKAGFDFCFFSKRASKLVQGGMSFEEAKQKILAQVGKNFDDFLADRKPGQPFCFWFGAVNTHRPIKKGSGQALWGIDPDSLRGKLPKFMPDVPEVRSDFADYMGEIQAWDAGIGVLIKKLEEIGELDNTIIVLSGDHGMPGVPGGKCNLYDQGVGVALMARGPGIKPGRVVDDFVNLMDIAPTFLEAAGEKPPEVMTGKSLLNVLQSEKSGEVDPDRTWVVTGRERHVADAREGNLPYPQRALRTPDFSTFATSPPTAGRWALPSSLAPRTCRLWRCWSKKPSTPLPTWMPAQPKPGSCTSLAKKTGHGITTTPSENAQARNSTICARTRIKRSTSPPIRPMPSSVRNSPRAC